MENMKTISDFPIAALNYSLVKLSCRDPFDDECLDLVVDLDVVEIDEADTAFIALS